MKSSLLSLVRGGLVAFGLLAFSVLGASTVGSPAPAFTLTDINGKTHQLSDFKGKTVVLEWTNPECPFVKKHYEKSGNLPATQKAAIDDGVVWLQINSAAPGKQGDYNVAAVKAWHEANKTSATAYLRDADGTVGKAYGAKTTPHMYVINAEGILVYKGAIDDKPTADARDIPTSVNYVKLALASVKINQPIAQANTAPYGCSVKY